MKHFFFIFIITIILSCSNDLKEVNELFTKEVLKVEEAKNVEILYSDSANVKVRITGKKLLRYLDKQSPRQEFPEGVYVEFFDNMGKPSSYMEAKYALRNDKDDIIIARDSVVLYNAQDEKLETSELFWEEESGKIYTSKFVRITQPERGDTSYGVGFESDRNFERFVIKRKYSATMTVEELSEALAE